MDTIIFILILFLLPAVLLFYLLQKVLDQKESKSKATLVLLLTSIIFNSALAQNYNSNLIPSGEGYGISNKLAYYVFGEDHFGHWNIDLFRMGYKISINVTIMLVIIYIGLLIFENRKKLRAHSLGEKGN